MRDASNRYRYGAGPTPESADAEFAGTVESVGPEPEFVSGYLVAVQSVGLTVTDVRRGSGISVGDYVDLDVAVVAGQNHVGVGNAGLPALDSSMVQAGVTLVAWANVGDDGRWQATGISTDGPSSGDNNYYAGRSPYRH
jgi:hypothetical protein